MSATAMQNKPVCEVIMKAVILYDDFELGTQVKAMLDRAAYRAETDTLSLECETRLRSIMEIGLANPVQATLTDAADAHLVVIALRDPGCAPSALLGWLEAWAAQRQEQAAALAVWGWGNEDAPSTNEMAKFSACAERHGLSFIVEGDDAVWDAELSRVDLQERAIAKTAMMAQILEPTTRDHAI
jgi:hypothetical protein